MNSSRIWLWYQCADLASVRGVDQVVGVIVGAALRVRHWGLPVPGLNILQKMGNKNQRFGKKIAEEMGTLTIWMSIIRILNDQMLKFIQLFSA